MTYLAPVVSLNSRRRLSCPHCEAVELPVAQLCRHIDFECPVLAAKRGRGDGDGAA